MKAYIYTRVSTTDQNLSPEWQGNVCKNYYEASLAHRGYEFGGVFHDHGESAYKIDWRDRTAGRELFNVIKPGDIIKITTEEEHPYRPR
jgi:DNA invertase Pin-like site-specific DNA recombinase